MQWWRNSTFDLGDVLTSVEAPGWFHERNRTSLNGYSDDGDGDRSVTVREVSTNFGRCYTLSFPRPAPVSSAGDYYSLHLDMSEVAGEGLVLYAHERGAEVGLHWGFWPVQPASVSVRKRDSWSLVAQRDTFARRKHLVGGCTRREQGLD